MPLIRGIRAWFGRRISDIDTVATQAAPYSQGLSWGSFFLFLVALPVIAVVVLIGLIYELVIRLDQRRLGKGVEWAISAASAVALLVGAYWVFIRN